MQTVTFKSVLFSAAKKHGLAPEQDGLDKSVSAQLTDGINTALKLAWEYFDWPLLMATASMEVVTHPDNSGAKYLPYASVNGVPTVGTLFRVWDRDPRLANGAVRIPFELLADGYYLPPATGASVWAQHRPVVPTFTDVLYQARAYAASEVVYDPASGDCWRVAFPPEGGAVPPPPPSGFIWARVEFPKFLAEAVKMGAVAALERGEGQGISALQLEDIMREWLDHELDQIFLQQQQGKAYRR